MHRILWFQTAAIYSNEECFYDATLFILRRVFI